MKSLKGPRSSAFMQLMNWIFRPLDFLEECDRIKSPLIELLN